MKALNARQRAAVEHAQGHLLIVAGPGTGKTHTLVERIASLAGALAQGEKALAITFTNKAAGELASRLSSLGIAPQAYETGTFHSFALRLLKQHRSLLGFPLDFRVVTPEEVEVLAAELWPEVRSKERAERLKRVAAWKASIVGRGDDADVLAFRRFLRERQCVDFDDILRDAVILLREHARVRDELAMTYRHILVDEYQDMSLIQEELLQLMAGGAQTVTAIGDPNQAIYGFRGSDVSLFERFGTLFSPCTVMALEENYRSSANLLAASGQVMCMSRFPVPELTARIHAQGFLKEHEALTERAEASYVAREIEHLIGGSGFEARQQGRAGDEAQASFGDIAVLYRLNAQAKALTEAFDKAGVPYAVSGQEAAPGGPEDVYGPRAEKVSLMTLHAAKGLEFDVVFIVGCEAGLIPLELEMFNTDIEEERRLFYVGMTRAKRSLYLVRARKRMLFGKTLGGAPSPFLKDIANDLKAVEARTPMRARPSDAQIQLF